MGARIKLAQTTEEIDGLFRLRHQVMVEEEAYMPAVPDRRLFDRFDTYPATGNVIAVVDGQVVGAIRVIEQSSAGTSAESYFDFHPFLPEGARPAALGMLAVAREFRALPRLVFALNGMAYYYAVSRGMTHIMTPANPERREAFLRTGHKIVAPEFRDPHSGLPVLPMILALDEMSDRFLAFVKRQRIRNWLESFHRQFHAAGETIVRRGDPGDFAFVVVDGDAVVLVHEGEADEQAFEIHPGELVGEVAILTDRPRTATVIARTDVDLMVLPRAALLEMVRTEPDLAEGLVRLLASRVASLLAF